jgi:diaminopimelate decarboxylase
MTGVASPFGFEEADLLRGAARLADLGPAVAVFGVHVYSGTQVESPGAVAANTRAAIRVAEALSDRLGLRLGAVDVGGGFPWPFARPGAGPNLGELREVLAAASAERERTASAALWFESGRFLSASSGTLLATVLDVKRSEDGKKFVVLDTGIHHLGGMSGLGRLPRPALVLGPGGAPADPGESEVVDVVGPLCTPLDCLARDIRAPGLRPGDVVRIPNVGAYGLTASLTHFTSRTPPLEVAHRNGFVVGLYRLAEGHRRLDPTAGLDRVEAPLPGNPP